MQTVCFAYGIFITRENYTKILQQLCAPLNDEQKTILFLGWDTKKDLETNINSGEDRDDDYDKFLDQSPLSDPRFMTEYFGETSFFDFIDQFRENYPLLSVADIQPNEAMMIYSTSSLRKFSECGTFEIAELTELNEEEEIQLKKFMNDFDFDMKTENLFYTMY